uniref:Guanylyl cyclase n=1 Tax=Ciona savignyi TaxID=51511 RepID=H2ZIQ2_CIOSA
MEFLDKLLQKFSQLKLKLPDSFQLDVEHVMQKDNWDCGIACLSMSLRYLEAKENLCFDVDAAISSHGLLKSVWTVDLAYLCSILGVKHSFTTVTLGVDNGYSEESFYVKSVNSFSDE